MPSLCQAALVWICMIVAPQAMHLKLRQHSYRIMDTMTFRGLRQKIMPNWPPIPMLDTLTYIPSPKQPDPDWGARIKIPFMLTGAHYKTGTVLMMELNAALSTTLAKRDPAGNATPYYSLHEYATEFGVGSEPTALSFHPACEYTYTNITSRSHHFRFVHVIRDPIEMVISGYWYLRRQPDDRGLFHEVVTRAEREQLLRDDVITGLEIVAQGMLKTTIPDMRGFLKASNGDVRVMTIGLEDFDSDFNKRLVACIAFCWNLLCLTTSSLL
eukprot:TRINITY_DN3623_c0_g1_i3.p1 TRINITY_DN3623_c0_g1~~TRINITY_DN3623_c0_g1_i3.p1  ORF type:complete len:270 (-),score=16.97 TRINITY_DN3623_c0_g1_i3:467-1276(-)